MQSAIALANKKDDRLRKEFEKWAVLTYTANRALINEKKGADGGIDGIAFFKVSYDDQKDVVAALGCPRSTLIGYKGGKEVARMSWGTSQEDVTKILQAVS